MAEISKLRNIGIAAHIDSGKTTLTERILFYTGRIHKVVETRSKDGGGPTMDSMDLEREKGITIQSAATYATWGDHNINIIDTPGHIDFTVEVERALRVLDGAVLVLCAVAGVQSQSITVDRQMKRYKVPRLAFINKCDRSGANPDRVVAQLKEKLSLNAVMVTMPMGVEDKMRGVVDLLTMKSVYFDGPQGEDIRIEEIPAEFLDEAKKKRNKLVEAVSDFDDAIAEKFLMEEEVSAEELRPIIRKATIDLKLVPVFAGTAFKYKGVQLLLDGVTEYLPSPLDMKYTALDADNDEAEFPLVCDPTKIPVLLAFKLEDGKYGQLTYMRIYQGKVKKGDFIYNSSNDKKFKVPRLVRMHANEMMDIEEAEAGDIIATFGIDCSSGGYFH